MAYIDIIEPEQAEGELKEVYNQIEEQRGAVAQVLMIQSLNPQALKTHLDLYMSIMFGKSKLKRSTREMLAVVVSCANNCEYCKTHHSEAVNHFWKDEERANKLCNDYTDIEMNDKEKALCDYAWHLTVSPHSKVKVKEHVNNLKKLGVTDEEILDAAQVIAYFNFVNRLVLGLGVELEEHRGKGFLYE